MEFWGSTNSGKVRKHNQDVFRTQSNEDKSVAILVVCDGMGGANAGNIASDLAAESFVSYISDRFNEIKENTDQNDIAVMMVDAVLAANTKVYEKSLQDEELDGMGTTLTAAVATNNGEVIVNIGDSRLYHVANGKITQITRDHSVVEDMIEKGEITRNEARRHPSRNLITRAIGTGYYEPPDVFFLKMNSGDSIILCSDGLTAVVSDNEIQYELLRDIPVRDICNVLVDMALIRGAPDNVTVVIFRKQ